ncbi:ParA family protein [Peribacillus simplex]|uniref:ParA family protein n=1 Tax=Peribacillus simplex TaxID=1478 RepID=UPI003D28AC1F
METLTFFNNKGGVGKTTLAVNIASYLQIEKDMRVLVVDADPQSNSTQMILDIEMWEKIYGPGSTETTLLNYLRPLTIGEASLSLDSEPISGEFNRFGVDIIAGHPKLSLLEDKLSSSWKDCSAGEIGGFRVTNWVNVLKEHFTDKYDIMIFDVGPSLGALNRSILLNTDYFITPMGCDVFSLMGIENISEWIKSWERVYKTSLLILEENYPGLDLSEYSITRDTSGNFLFAGYSVQQYITKVIDGKRRGIAAYERIKKQIPEALEKNLGDFLPPNISMRDCDLGDIPNLFSLVPLAQTSNAPIHQLKKSDGVVGNHYKMIKDYSTVMDLITNKILSNIGVI